MRKTALALMIMANLSLTISACQPQSDTSTTVNSSDSSDKISTPTQPPVHATTPVALTASLIESSENQLKNQLICTKLSKAMGDIDEKSKIEDIHAIQRQLSACLPITDNIKVLQWLADYQAMYTRFLSEGNDIDDQSFNSVMYALDQGEKVSPEQLKTMSPRVRYLIQLVKSDADVRISSLGEGYYAFDHNLKAMADLFTPYLHQDQKAFIQRMAIDNQDILWSDAAIAISLDEVIERAQFWEGYTQRYPDGYSVKDAKDLLNLYRYIIIFGSENTQWTDDAVHGFISPEYEQAMRRLTKRSNSILAKDARDLFRFMDMSDAKRQQKYPAPSVDKDGDEMNDWAKVRYQFVEAMSIRLGENDDSRDCLNGVICMDNSVE